MHIVEILKARASASGIIAGTACLGLLASFGGVVSAAGQGNGAGANAQIDFDIPAEPLAAALERYSVLSGRQVVYDGTLTAERRSAAIKGDFTPEAALQMLLAGTGLTPRYVAADAFMLVRAPEATPAHQDVLVNSASPAAVAQYYGLIQAGLKSAFCGNDWTRLGGYRIALGLWIGASGAVSSTVLLSSTGNANLDMTIDRTVRGIAIGEPPPTGFAQPVILVVVPALTRDCQALQESIGTGP